MPLMSIVICVYNMHREAPRTIISVLPPYQKGVTLQDYEVIIVDNGSTQPIEEVFLAELPSMVKYVKYPGSTSSPGVAINWAVDCVAKGDSVMICIDGARIFSDGLVANALKYSSLCDNYFVYALAWHLGSERQNKAALNGYNQQVEDELLKRSDWFNSPGNLFLNSVLSPSSKYGFFAPISESSSFVVSRKMWNAVGWYDERFSLPGGGLSNLEIFARYVSQKETVPVCLYGEGTFHQYHGGSATGNVVGWDEFHEEYKRIFERNYELPKYTPMLGGLIRPEAAKFYQLALEYQIVWGS